MFCVPKGDTLSEPLYPSTKQFFFYPSPWFKKCKIIKLYGKTNNGNGQPLRASGPGLSQCLPPTPHSHLCSSDLFAVGTLQQLLLRPGFCFTVRELGPYGSLSTAACYSGNRLSGSRWGTHVFRFAVLGNALAEAGPVSFLHVLGMLSRVGELRCCPFIWSWVASEVALAQSDPLFSSARPKCAGTHILLGQEGE